MQSVDTMKTQNVIRQTALWILSLGTLTHIGPIRLAAADASGTLKVLIVTGQNNHNWRASTPILWRTLEEGGRFTVDVATTPPPAPRPPEALKADATPKQQTDFERARKQWESDKLAYDRTEVPHWQAWRPKFGEYAAVLCNYAGDAWPEAVRKDFVAYVRGGGGVVIVHAADNAFPNWPEYNEIIGLGGWDGRDEKCGPYVRWREGKVVYDTTPGIAGSHGKQHEYVIETREPENPIVQGLPLRWKHTQDELYAQLRGPAKNLTVLATAFSAKETGGTGENEPILMTITYGQGRIFHTVLGDGPPALNCVGFQVTLVRGTEWAATGRVTQTKLPDDFPTADKASARP